VAFPPVNFAALSDLRRLVDNCHHRDGNCSYIRSLWHNETLSDPPLLPRRVIDVGDLNSEQGPSPYLYETMKDDRAHYTTLSHRWGDRLTFKTTRENIQALHEGIDFKALPMSFQDAINVTRALHVRYLWIDAICIIQDEPDHSDWTEQAPLMGKIYKNSRCTIAAHSAQDSTMGFLECSSPHSAIRVASRSNPEVGAGKLYLGVPRTFKETIDFSHIKNRGWVLQELTLSQRIAHFSNGYVYFDCPHTTRTPKSVGYTAGPSMQASTIMKTLGTGVKFVESWLSLVTEYSKCELTYGTDKLVAISGIATDWQSRLEQGVRISYLSGLFECALPQGLLWYSGTGGPLVKCEQRAPSWSWASVDGPVQFMNTRKATAVATIKGEDNHGNSSEVSDSLSCQLMMHASITEALITGIQVEFGAEAMQAESFLRPRGATITGSGLEIPGYASIDRWGQASLDNGSRASKSVYCARVCTSYILLKDHEKQLDQQQRDFLIILEPVHPESIRYKRIGVGTILSSGARAIENFHWPPSQDIVVI
jgi:hypothetical protein